MSQEIQRCISSVYNAIELFNACYEFNEIRHWLLNSNFTDLDLLIDTSLLTERSGEQFKKFTLTYKDLLGKEISLRPDLTVSTALKYIQEKKNKEEKYCYYGSAYRLDKEGDLKVFDQIGCEIINSYNMILLS